MEWGAYVGDNEVPDIREAALEVRVLPDPWNEMPWRAWHELQHDRAWMTDGIGASMGTISIVSRPGPISWMAIDRWCDVNGVTAEERPYVLDLIRVLDAVFLKDRNSTITQNLQTLIRK
ncbi:hypothetical protein [Gluconobacter sp. GP1]|uniref:phage tail assembly chaperone n=1 Tax=Gluconobacter sp. GP1 TaxID=3046423 RepID=UPI00293EA935|nr:hypothetical protein [Gluconobacter sp. GP1]